MSVEYWYLIMNRNRIFKKWVFSYQLQTMHNYNTLFSIIVKWKVVMDFKFEIICYCLKRISIFKKTKLFIISYTLCIITVLFHIIKQYLMFFIYLFICLKFILDAVLLNARSTIIQINSEYGLGFYRKL